MRRLTLTLLSGVVALALASFLLPTPVEAQDAPVRIVFVNSQIAIAAHPAGQAARELEAQARTEIDELRTVLDELNAKATGGQELSAAERESYQITLTTLNSVQQRYQADIAAAAEPAIVAVNEVIAQLAQENGYTLVLDRAEAQGLVVYAPEELDITQLVIERIEAQ